MPRILQPALAAIDVGMQETEDLARPVDGQLVILQESGQLVTGEAAVDRLLADIGMTREELARLRSAS